MRLGGGNQGWRVVVPVRDPRTGKSRLGAGPELNTAIAYDTVSAALHCPEVKELLLVTDDPWWIGADLRAAPRLSVLVHPEPGLNPAVRAGLREAAAGAPARAAVMLGDLPGLRPEDLSLALRAAADVPAGMLADRQGAGTTLLTGVRHGVHFGPDSAARHRRAGHRELPLSPASTVRWDVDTPEDLERAAAQIGLGPRTRRLLAASAPPRPQPGLVAPRTSVEVAYA